MPMHEDHHLDETALHEYLDDVLDPAKRSEVDAHIADCPLCSHRLQVLRDLFLSLTSLVDVPVERDLVPSVMSSIRSRNRFFLGFNFAIAVQILTLGLLLIIAWPYISAAIGEIVTSPFATWFTTDAIDVFANVSRIWLAVLESVTGLISRSLDNFRDMPVFSWPMLDGWLMVGVIAIIWLVGNGLLLRVTRSDRRSR
jgi:hypothetical protein